MGCGISKIDPDEVGGQFKRLPKRNVDYSAIASQDVSGDLSMPIQYERNSVSANKVESNYQVQKLSATKSADNHNINNNERRSAYSPIDYNERISASYPIGYNERISASSPTGNNERISASSPTYYNERRSSAYQVGKGEPDHQEQEVVNAKNGEANCNGCRSFYPPVGNEGELDHHQAQVYEEKNAKKAAVDNFKEGFGVGNGRKYNKEFAAEAMTVEEENGGHRKHGHEEDKESVDDRGDSIAWPGSPSFREYCLNNGSGLAKGKNKDRIGLKGENKSQAGGSLNSEMESEHADSTKKRRSIGKGIRNAMHMPAAWMSRQK